MAPVMCMSDFSMPRTDAAYPYARRRQRNRRSTVGIVEKYRTLEIRQMSGARARLNSSHNATQSSSCPTSVLEESSDSNYRNNHLETSFSTRIPIEREEQLIILKRRAGLLNIVARTLDLIRRNQILEKKVEALRLETRSFVDSVFNNCENRTENFRICDESSSCQDSSVNNSVSSTTNENSSWTQSEIINDWDEKSKEIISNDQSFDQSCSERETSSTDTIVH